MRDFGVKKRKERRKEEKMPNAHKEPRDFSNVAPPYHSLQPPTPRSPMICRQQGCFKEEAASGRRAGEREEERLGQPVDVKKEDGEETFVDDLYAFYPLFPL